MEGENTSPGEVIRNATASSGSETQNPNDLAASLEDADLIPGKLPAHAVSIEICGKDGIGTHWLESRAGDFKDGDLKGHEGQVSMVEWSPDGQMIASASQDTTIRLWLVGSLLEGGGNRHPGAASNATTVDDAGQQKQQSGDDDVGMQVLGSLGAWATRTAFSPDSGSLAAVGLAAHLHVYKYLRPASAKQLLDKTMVGPSELLPEDAAVLGLPLDLVK